MALAAETAGKLPAQPSSVFLISQWQAGSLPYVLETHRGNNTLANAFVANAVGIGKGGSHATRGDFWIDVFGDRRCCRAGGRRRRAAAGEISRHPQPG